MNEHHKLAVDLAALGGVVATLVGWLPHIAAGLSIIWTAIRIWETKTVQGWIDVVRARKARP